MKTLFQSRSARILTLILLAQASMFYGFSRREDVPAHRALENFSLPVGSGWKLIEDSKLDPETLDVLKADDILSRYYANPQTSQQATLFVAYFETQRTGKAPHSPKNCLPGSGWVSSQSGTTDITVPGQPHPVRVNQYIVSRGQNQSVVLYWYQSRDRVIASEYSAKIFTVSDAIRFNRSDTALVRVVVGVNDGDTKKAEETATSFVQTFFTPLKNYLPA